MIDLIIKVNDNGPWKEGMIVDYVEGRKPVYSREMRKRFLIVSVPDSWLPRIKIACESEGEEESRDFKPRKGLIDVDALITATNKFDKSALRDRRIQIEKVDGKSLSDALVRESWR